MGDNDYGCIYFQSDNTVSVLLQSRILIGAFEERGEVDVRGNTKHSLGSFSAFAQRVSKPLKLYCVLSKH